MSEPTKEAYAMNRTTKPASGLLVLAVLATVILTACLPLPADTLQSGSQAAVSSEATPQVGSQTATQEAAVPVPEVAATAVTEAAAIVTPEGLPPALEGPLWMLVSYADEQGSTVDVLPESEVTAQFQDGNVTGTAGCNNYFAGYEVDGNQLSVTSGGMTMMACEETIMVQEWAYMENLAASSSFTITGDELQIAGGDGEILLTYRVRQPTQLTGVTWQLIVYNNGKEALVSTLAGTEITAIFTEDGILSGSAGCNNYHASYTVADDALTIETPATTRMMCADPKGVMDQETAYLALLPLAASYSILGDELEIVDAEGTTLLTYRAAGESPTTPPPSTVEEGNAPAIIGAPWQWVATLYNDDTKSVPDNPENYVMELLPDGQLTVKADCNQGVGTYSLEGDRISINVAAMTLAACAPGSLGDRFVRDLNAAQSYLMDGEDLIIVLKLDTGSMRLEVPEEAPSVAPAIEPPPFEPSPIPLATTVAEPSVETGGGIADIMGVIWMWEGFTSAAGESLQVDNPEQYEFMLLPTGTIRVKADCNNGSGTYSTDGNNISIEVLTLTRAACAPDSRSDEFVQALDQASTYQVKGGNLLLVGEAGDTMKFSPAE
jgi:heat shock protein HslJ